MENPKTKFVYTGVCELNDGKAGSILRAVKDDGSLAAERIFSEKNIKKAGVILGGIYEIETTPDEASIFPSTAIYQGMWHVEADKAEWKASERAFRILAIAKKREKEDRSLNAMREALAPIRAAWLKTNSAGRLAIEVQTLAYIRAQRIAE